MEGGKPKCDQINRG